MSLLTIGIVAIILVAVLWLFLDFQVATCLISCLLSSLNRISAKLFNK